MPKNYYIEILKASIDSKEGTNIVVGRINYRRNHFESRVVTSIPVHAFKTDLNYSDLLEMYHEQGRRHLVAKNQIIHLALRRGIKEKLA